MPNSHHSGCNFHFVHAIYLQMQHLQLTTVYRNDETACSAVRKLIALAPVPYETIEPAFKLISSEASH
ncbi:unnamed protein product [Rotaria sp. Silwood2]|nr:unnamed protein product [Rotaria sp. Silwood2]